MNRIRIFILALPMMLTSCQTISDKETIAKLRRMQIEIKEEKIEGGIEKAMQGYQRFLQETPESDLKPEAIRRLADLKIEKEYGTLNEGPRPAVPAPVPALPAPERAAPYPPPRPFPSNLKEQAQTPVSPKESESEFEGRATRTGQVPPVAAAAGGR